MFSVYCYLLIIKFLFNSTDHTEDDIFVAIKKGDLKTYSVESIANQ